MFNKKMKAWLAVGALAAVLAVSGCGGNGDKAKSGDAAKSGVPSIVRVGAETTFPPFEFTKDDKYVGFDLDLAEAVIKQMGSKMEFKSMGFDALIPAVQSGQIDMIASGLSANPEREKQVAFSDVYFDKNGFVIIVNKDNDSLKDWADLEGKKVGAQVGTEPVKMIQEAKGEVKQLDSNAQAFMELRAKTLDAFVVDQPVAMFYMKQGGSEDLKIVGTPKTDVGFVFAMKKENKELQAAVNKALKELKANGEYDKIFIMIADAQALTDNADNPAKVRSNIMEVALDYLSVGIDPAKSDIFIQSYVTELTELTFYYMNLVTVSRLQRNPTVKSEIQMRNFETSIPVGFFCYPISQAADITAFHATTVPVGEDQMPMLEQTKEIVHKFNAVYGETLTDPQILLPENKACLRLPGTDGKAKMSKSLGNCIYLSEPEADVKKKIMSMYTDPNHIRIEDPGNLEGNTVFTYLDAFCNDGHFAEYLPEYSCLQELKDHYTRGGLGDVKVKKFLNNVMQEELSPIRARRKEYENRIGDVDRKSVV